MFVRAEHAVRIRHHHQNRSHRRHDCHHRCWQRSLYCHRPDRHHLTHHARERKCLCSPCTARPLPASMCAQQQLGNEARGAGKCRIASRHNPGKHVCAANCSASHGHGYGHTGYTEFTHSLHTVYTQFTRSLHTELYTLSRGPHPSTPPHRARRCLRARIHCPGSPCQHGVA